MSRCPEAVIFTHREDDGPLVIVQCERDGGHDGSHSATTERGTAEWPRIDETASAPLADWEKDLICDRCGASCCGCRADEIAAKEEAA